MLHGECVPWGSTRVLPIAMSFWEERKNIVRSVLAYRGSLLTRTGPSIPREYKGGHTRPTLSTPIHVGVGTV